MNNPFITFWHDRRVPPRKEIVARMLLSVLAMATAMLSLTAQATFTYAMLRAGGPLAFAAVSAMGVLGVVLFCDTFINDVLPVRFQLHWARRCRQGMWMTLGLLFVLFAYLVFTARLSTSLSTYLICYGLGSFMLAFVDAATEKMDRQRCAT